MRDKADLSVGRLAFVPARVRAALSMTGRGQGTEISGSTGAVSADGEIEVTQTDEQPRRLWTALVEHRFGALALVGLVQLGGAIWLATWVRYEFDIPEHAIERGVEGHPRSWSPCSSPRASGRASTAVAGTSAPSRRSPRCSRRWCCPRSCSSSSTSRCAGCRSACPWPPSSWPSWPWPPLRYTWRLVIERRKRPERRGHGSGARVRRRRGCRTGDHRHAPRSRQPLPPGRHGRRRPPQAAAPHPRRAGVRHPRRHRLRSPHDKHAEVLLIAVPVRRRRPDPRAGPARRTGGPQGAGGPARERPLRRPRRPRRHPAPHHRRPPRPPRDRHRHRRHRRLPHRPPGARHRRRRLDRLRAVPPGAHLRPRASS